MAKRRGRGDARPPAEFRSVIEERQAQAERQAEALSAFVAEQQGGGEDLADRVPDRAGDLPGTQLNDPDVTATSGVHAHSIQPQRRGQGGR